MTKTMVKTNDKITLVNNVKYTMVRWVLVKGLRIIVFLKSVKKREKLLHHQHGIIDS